MFMHSKTFCAGFRTDRGHVVGIRARVTESAGWVCDISNDANSFCLGMMATLGSDDLI
jgi:hypothetical protein